MRRARASRPSPLLNARTRRTAPPFAALAVLALALGLAACGGSPGAASTTTSTTTGQTSSAGPPARPQQAALLRYAACVRSHGVPNFPDPSNGFLSVPAGLNPNSPQFQSANQACQGLLPNGGSQQVTSPQNLAGLVKFAACMTKRGIPMSASGNGSVSFGNADPNSPQFQSASQACKKLVPDGLP